MNWTSSAFGYHHHSSKKPNDPLADFRFMHALLLGIFASALASFAGIYGLLSWVCYLADHDRLVMLHMYSSSIILSGAYGIILPLNIDKLHALGSRLKRRIH